MKSLELRIPPVVVMVGAMCLMGLIAVQMPALVFAIPGREVITALLVATGLVIASAGIMAFRRAATTANPMRPEDSSSLVNTGIYRMTRNPMYLGILLMLLGWAVWLANIASFLLLPLFVAYMNRFQIKPEERALRAKFGESFDTYARTVRRWV